MTRKYLFIFITPLAILFFFNQIVNSQTPAELTKVVPQAEEKLDSPDVSERVAVLDKLVVYERDYDITKTLLPFEFSPKTYAFVIGKIFEKDLAQTDEKTASRAFSKIEFLMQKFALKEFAKNLVEYIPKFVPNGQTDFSRVGIQYGILATLKNLQAAEYTPQIAALLQPSIRSLYREALSTLVELRAREAVPALISQLYDVNYLERYSALQSLVKINGREAAAHIAKLLNDEHANNRYWALDALIKLGAREHAGKFWQLVNSNQTAQTESYAIAGLVRFGDAKAIEIAAQKLSENKEEDRLLLEQLIGTNAVQIVPKLIALLENADYSRANAYKFRTDVIYALGKFDARESAPVLRKMLNTFAGRIPAIQVLGNFGDRDSVDDLLAIFYEHLPNPPDRITNQTFESAEAAVALAKIGDKKVWRELIAVAENPKYPSRSQIIQKLNKQIDANLWKKTQETPVKGIDYKSIKENAEILSGESGVSILLEFDPQIHKTRGVSPTDPKYPQLRAGYETNLNFYLESIISNIDAGTTPNTFTFIFDKGKIRIVRVEDAVQWWRKNIL